MEELRPNVPDEAATHKETPKDDEGAQPDPFDLVALRQSQDFLTTLDVKEALLTVPVRKPAKEWWVRTHPSQDFRINAAVLELKEEQETYWVTPTLWPGLSTESTFSPRALITAINRQKVVFIWPIRIPGEDGRLDEWSRSALEAAEMAQHNWVRVQANMGLKAYQVAEAEDQSEPDWPTQTFDELLRIAFKDRLIESLDHPVLKRLRGEV